MRSSHSNAMESAYANALHCCISVHFLLSPSRRRRWESSTQSPQRGTVANLIHYTMMMVGTAGPMPYDASKPNVPKRVAETGRIHPLRSHIDGNYCFSSAAISFAMGFALFNKISMMQ